MTKTRPLVALGFLVFLAGALYISFSFPKDAKVLPLLFLIPGVLLAGWNLVLELRPHADAADQDKESTEAGNKGLFYLIFLAALALPLLSWLFGITIGLPLFMLIYLRWVSREKWGIVVFSTILSWVILYLGFEVLMRSNFERGVLFDLILS
jgi:hypothetical protein